MYGYDASRRQRGNLYDYDFVAWDFILSADRVY